MAAVLDNFQYPQLNYPRCSFLQTEHEHVKASEFSYSVNSLENSLGHTRIFPNMVRISLFQNNRKDHDILPYLDINNISSLYHYLIWLHKCFQWIIRVYATSLETIVWKGDRTGELILMSWITYVKVQALLLDKETKFVTSSSIITKTIKKLS